MKARLGYVIRFASDLERSVAFYRDSLGLEVEHEAPGYAAFRVDGPVVFALLARERVAGLVEDESLPPPQDRHEGEIVFLTDDVDALYETLVEKSVAFLCPPTDRPWGERTAYFKDPDGYLVEIAAKQRPTD